MELKRIQLGMIQTNCYIFWDENTLDCAVVDPGDDGEKVAAFIQGRGLNPVAILLTHGHFDHILGIPGLRSQWPQLPIYCHPLDADPNETTTSLFGTTFPSVSSFGNVRHYGEGDRVQVGGLTVHVLHTPGHTPGGVVLQVEDVLFTGDTLFEGSMGRTDLEGGSEEALLRSLKRLYNLPGDFRVYPGHEGSSTLEKERTTNVCMLEAVRRG